MPTIFDLFGFPSSDRSENVENLRKARTCPFTDAICDGGGNRYQTEIKLVPSEPLAAYFNSDVSSVIPGVCSIMAGEDIWVVCPRRLFAARSSGEGVPQVNYALQSYERMLLTQAGLPQNIELGFWPEVTLHQRVVDADINYHFDYVAAPLVETSLRNLLEYLGYANKTIADEIEGLTALAKKSGYYHRGQQNLSEVSTLLPDITHPYIVEIMTASTSGSDSEKSTDLRSAFRNALLSNDHTSPGINKRQVWGRMVTQLFAKTALAKAWGGKAIWVIQDELLRNIELTTKLKTRAVKEHANQNITFIVMHYDRQPEGKRTMAFKSVISGDSGIDFDGSNSFTDILLPKIIPPKIELLRAILRRSVGAIIRL